MSLLAPSWPATSSAASAWQARQPSVSTSAFPLAASSPPAAPAGAGCAASHSSLGCLVSESRKAAIWTACSSSNMKFGMRVRGRNSCGFLIQRTSQPWSTFAPMRRSDGAIDVTPPIFARSS